MYATHPTLVEQESYLFHKLGFDVYSAAWATNKTTHFSSFDNKGRFSETSIFNPNHFYQGVCSFLSVDVVDAVSKIDVLWARKPLYDGDIKNVLVNNFDVLYVSAPTYWLLYAEDFLKAGKTVIYRAFIYHPDSWGKVDLSGLFKYDKFFVVTCMPLFNQYYKRAYSAITFINDELICKSNTEGSYVLTIYPEMDINIRQNINNELSIENVPWKVHEYWKDPKIWLSGREFNDLFNNCLLFADLNTGIRYPILESIIRGKPIVVYGNSMLGNYLISNKMLNSNDGFLYANYNNASKVIINMFRDKNLREQVIKKQSLWLNNMLNDAIEVWREVLGINDKT